MVRKLGCLSVSSKLLSAPCRRWTSEDQRRFRRDSWIPDGGRLLNQLSRLK